MSEVSRRSFLRNFSTGLSGALVFGTAAQSSGIEPGLDTEKAAGLGDKFSPTEFQHGVASGDPLQDRLIIWTRLTIKRRARWLTHRYGVPVAWEVSRDPNFKRLVRRGVTLARRNRDYTVKVDLVGLKPGTKYYYRFKSLGSRSPVGTGKTLPGNGVSRVKLAVMSCSNFPAGYFNVYKDASQIPDLDAVCHLGDYIYEYGPGGYATENADTIGRGFEEGNDLELLRLRDYRKRYAQYRTDEGCQALHASAPFICVWDDHEIANDAWREGAENHNEGEGSFEARKLAAIRAYYEWMPIRPPAGEFASEEIYRRFDFGDLVSLHMLDTRVIGRDQQLNYADYFNLDGSFDTARFTADVTASDRTILGTEQLAWLQAGLVTSSATWQVLGQQVLLGRMNIPAELLPSLANPSPEILATLAELATIKGRILAGDPSVTDAERARVETVTPYNLDAWDGYFFEREILLGTAQAANKNLVAISGDTHNAWANNLTDLAGNPVGVEFATSSVTSPGLEDVLGIPSLLAGDAAFAIETLIDGLYYANIADRGYMTVTFTPAEAVADWTYVDNIQSTDYSTIDSRSRRLKTRAGMAGRFIEEA